MPKIDYREDPVDPEVTKKFEQKGPSQHYDPCQDAANRSLKCMRRNMGDREMCVDYFQAYRDCKKKWVEERKARKWKAFEGWSGWTQTSEQKADEDAKAAVAAAAASKSAEKGGSS